MAFILQLVILIISVVIIMSSIFWFKKSKGWEPWIGILSGIVLLLTTGYTILQDHDDISPITIIDNSRTTNIYPVTRDSVLVSKRASHSVIDTFKDLNDKIQFKVDKVVFQLPPETRISIVARSFVEIYKPQNERINFSFSNRLQDTVRIFSCKNVGSNQVEIYALSAHKTLKKLTAVLDLRDPNDYCQDN
jgi:hypothetical protein